MASRLRDIAASVYSNTIEEYMPRKITTVNGVKTRKHRLLRFSEEPNYEQESVDSIKSHSKSDDTVIILGGGWGVTAVWAARVASNVIVFEAANERVATVQEAIKLNNVAESVTVRHEIVGEAKRVIGSSSGADIIRPTELPECDVLEMDIEGAELIVLDGLRITPRVIIVETHINRGTSVNAVKKKLTEMGYEIVSSKKQSDKNSIITAIQN